MSKLSPFLSRESRTLVDHVLARLTAIYGAQKMATSWAADSDEQMAEMHATWAEAMQGYAAETIGKALRICMEEGPDWPPTLPQFMAMVREADEELRQHGRRQAVLRLGDDSRIAPVESPAVAEFRQSLSALAKAKAVTRPVLAPRVERQRAAEERRASEAHEEGFGGLPALMGLVAQAAALAGQDEAQILRTVESRLVAA